jgi:hypothetical protein
MTKRRLPVLALALGGLSIGLGGGVGRSDDGDGNACAGLPSPSALGKALKTARMQPNGGFNLDMWGTVVNRDGVVCAVAFTGGNRGDQWPGSRVISAQKANKANAFQPAGPGAFHGQPL